MNVSLKILEESHVPVGATSVATAGHNRSRYHASPTYGV